MIQVNELMTESPENKKALRKFTFTESSHFSNSIQILLYISVLFTTNNTYCLKFLSPSARNINSRLTDYFNFMKNPVTTRFAVRLMPGFSYEEILLMSFLYDCL